MQNQRERKLLSDADEQSHSEVLSEHCLIYGTMGRDNEADRSNADRSSAHIQADDRHPSLSSDI
jgi:hypothetical protein